MLNQMELCRTETSMLDDMKPGDSVPRGTGIDDELEHDQYLDDVCDAFPEDMLLHVNSTEIESEVKMPEE